MNRFNRLKLTTRLLISLGVILGFVTLLGLVAVADLANVARNSDDITGHWMQSIEHLNQLNGDVANLRIQELRSATSATHEETQQHVREADMLLAQLSQTRASYEKLISGADERALWEAYLQRWRDYLSFHERAAAFILEGKPAEALHLIGDGGKVVYDELRLRLQADLRYNTQAAATATVASHQIYTSARATMAGLVVLALLVASLIGLNLAHAISRPLTHVVKVFGNMAAGLLDNRIESHGADEIGQVLEGLEKMQTQLRKLIAETNGQLAAINKAQAVIEFDLQGNILTANEHFLRAMGYSLDEVQGRHHSLFVAPAERSGDAYLRFWEKLRSGEYDKARYLRLGKGDRKVWIDASYNPIFDADGKPYKVVKYANDVTVHVIASQQMERAVAQMQQVIKSAGDGDLTVRVPLKDKEGNLGKMAESVNTLLHNMAEIVGKVKSAATEVHQGAEEIALGNTHLSQRTEEQASSLEETASSMEEMTATVKQNADNASQASQLAGAARDQAHQGGAITSRAVHAMTEINEASKKVVDIIRVIDDIAFQTNLLALNAAVEAARAGEQGRGFAVVAQEVRGLASRSAVAAQEIKELIEDSVRKVGDGSLLVTQSGQTLEQIVLAVKKVSDIVAEIAAASREQSSGIDQVNKAVMQMDEMTQQNAALVEQATAGSQSLTEQARNLSVLMSAYRVTNGSDTSEQVGAHSAPLKAASRQVERPQREGARQQQLGAAVNERKRPVQVVGSDSGWMEF
jgi:methyl-accepting chemotaxis protein